MAFEVKGGLLEVVGVYTCSNISKTIVFSSADAGVLCVDFMPFQWTSSLRSPNVPAKVGYRSKPEEKDTHCFASDHSATSNDDDWTGTLVLQNQLGKVYGISTCGEEWCSIPW